MIARFELARIFVGGMFVRRSSSEYVIKRREFVVISHAPQAHASINKKTSTSTPFRRHNHDTMVTSPNKLPAAASVQNVFPIRQDQTSPHFLTSYMKSDLNSERCTYVVQLSSLAGP